MKLTTDESRALTFIAGLLLLSAAVRIAALREPVELPATAGFDLASHIDATRAAVAEAERAARPLEPGERIDLNAADAIELQRLPGVGPALADRIVEYRGTEGLFRSMEDFARVRGIGDRMLEKIQPHVALPRTALGSGAGASGGLSRGSVAGSPGRASARAAEGRGGAVGASAARGLVDLNRADAAALATLPGIGPVLAGRIVAYRDSAGPFRDVEALDSVKGVGPATLARLKELVRVGG